MWWVNVSSTTSYKNEFAFKVSINLKQQLADDNFEGMAPSVLQRKVNNICKRMSKMLL